MRHALGFWASDASCSIHTTREPVSFFTKQARKREDMSRVSHDSSLWHAVARRARSSNGLHLSEDASGCPPLSGQQWTTTHEYLVEVASCQKKNAAKGETACPALSESPPRESQTTKGGFIVSRSKANLPAAEGDAHACGALLGCLLRWFVCFRT